MTDDVTGTEITPLPDGSLVLRSEVPVGLQYGDYKIFLRVDFFYSCAYCTIMETEAQTIRFTIDHYEPQKKRPDLMHQYDNLMYSCDTCNIRKGDRVPNEKQKEKGCRFFRPDNDVYEDHFERVGIRLEHKTAIGYFTINGLDLNRQPLRRVRELRERATKCDKFVLGGILSLKKFQLDQLPPHIRGQAAHLIQQAMTFGKKVTESIDSLLAQNARAELADEDTETKARAKDRSMRLKQLNGLEPGILKAVTR